MLIQPHKDFLTLFNQKEGKELMGKNYSNFIVLLIILSITFLVIGFSTGSINYLQTKMDDPFITGLDVVISWTNNADTIKEKIKRMNRDSVGKQKFNYYNVTPYNRYNLPIFDHESDFEVSVYGRTIDIKNPLIDKIFCNENIVIKESRRFRDSIDKGIVVTRKFLEKFHYPLTSLFIDLSVPTDSGDLRIPVPVIGVVKDLPGLNMFLTTDYFRRQKETPMASGRNPFNPYSHDPLPLVCFIGNETEKTAYEFRNAVDSFFKKELFKKLAHNTLTTPDKDSSTYKLGYIVNVSFEKDLDTIYPKRLNKIFKELIASKELNSFNKTEIYQTYAYPFHNEKEENKKGDYFTVNFTSLGKAKPFKEYLLKTYGLEVDMENIETRNNYFLIATLTKIIAVIMVLFSIVSINIFISNVLIKHLESISMNIGTLKAFGLGNITLKKIYVRLTMKYMIIAMFLSLILSGMFGYLGGIKMILQFKIELEENQKYFDLLGWSTLITILAISVITYITLTRVIRKILNRTPGDLIYGRN